MKIKEKSRNTNYISTTLSRSKKVLITASALFVLTLIVVGSSSLFSAMMAGTITGTVFQDFNGNGLSDTTGGTTDAPTAVDTGVAGITVTAYDSAGTAQGSTTTAANGTYSLSATGTGPYRIEFTTLPAGFQPSARSTDSVGSGTATSSGSTVQFVSDGNSSNINLAINRPEEYCQNNPQLATCRFNRGAQNGTFAANPALQRFAYDSGTVYTDATAANYDVPSAATIAPASRVGSLYGLAYRRSTQRIYASAYYRRYAGFGPGANGTIDASPSTTSDDSSAVYVINPATGATVTTFTVPNAATNNHSNAAADDTTNASWDAVGKTSLGGIALADDESRLFVMNLQNKTLYALNPTTGASLGSQAIPTGIASCPDADVRPFALKFYRGNLYAGMVCSAESTATAANLRAYVYQVNPTTLAFGVTPYTFSLNYNRGFNEPAQGATTFPDEWRPWITTPQSTFTYPQPMLTDIEFDNGNMVLGIRDRVGDQGLDVGAAAGFRPAGEVLRSCGAFTAANFPGTLTLEANGRCGGAGTAPQNTGQGPGAAPGTTAGSGEFYFQDDYSNPANSVNYHDEVLSSGLLHIAGYRQTISSVFDPISRTAGAGDQTFDQGFRWLDNTTGGTTKAYRLFDGDGDTSTGGEFGKANGLGDIIPLCDSAPIEIGNRIWIDTDGDGIQDPQTATETGRANVTVELYTGDLNGDGDILDTNENVLVGTTTTDANGEWYFNNANIADGDPTTAGNQAGLRLNTNYIARIGTADFTGGAGIGDLAGLVVTRANTATLLGTETAGANNTDSRDSDATVIGGPAEIGFNSSTAGSNNHNLDFGFVAPVSIGSTVFNDANNNGLFDAGEAGIGDVSVELLYDANNDGVINGAELTTAIATTTTGTVAGSVGNYFFGNLVPGNYQVRIPAPPATATLSSAPAVTDTADNQQDNDDNGTQTGGAGGSTISPLIALTVDGEPLNAVETGQGGTQDDSDDNNGDMTVDFGFLAPAALGNRLWIDTDRDGIQDAGETAGVDGVTVTLYNSTGTAIATTTTAGGGLYSFTGLFPGTYSVGFARPNGYGFSPQDAAGSTEANDSDVNILTGRTATVTLIAGQTNNDLDAGVFLSVAVGNRVWNDANNNGLFDAGEGAIVGATVNLYLDADNNATPDGAAIRTTTTDASGLYQFDGLAPDTYIIGVVTPANFISSSVDGGDADADDDPDTDVQDSDDNGVVVSGNETRSNPVTLSVGGEPTGETPADTTTPDNASNFTVDFGFTPNYSLGNRVWFDTNNNGQIDAGEVGIANVSVSVFAVGNPTALQTVITDANGYYRFDNLVAGQYTVRIDPTNFIATDPDTTDALVGYQNTAGNNAADLDSTATAGQNGEDGVNPTGAANTVQTNGISSSTITLGALGEPTGEGDVQASGQGTADNQANMTIDFGFYRMSLSGTVWRDTGAGANNNNGLLDAGETGIANVIVRLYNSANVEIPVGADGILGTADDNNNGMVTNASGVYNFQGLAPGTYRVVVTSNGATSSTGGGNNTNPDTNVDNDDNGFPDNTGSFPGRTISGTIVLTAGGEPTVTNATGSTVNTTVDFGFITTPTAVKLVSFDAFANDNGGVTLVWQTGGEAENLGFNVYREANGKRELLNASPIAGSALRTNADLQASGDSYSWFDAQSAPGARYYLEDIALDGTTNLHDAVSVKAQSEDNTAIVSSRMLSDLTEVATAKQTDAPDVSAPEAKAGNRSVQNAVAVRGGVKITVRRDGWYRVSAEQLQNAGFDLSGNNANWQMFANGAEVPFKLNADASIEFFGRGLDTISTDRQVYYLIVGAAQGKRIAEIKGGSTNETADALSFRNVVVRRDRGIYAAGILNGEAENWFGAMVNPTNATEQDLTVNNPDENGANARLTVKLQGLTMTDHLVNVRLNGFDLGTVAYQSRENRAFELDVPTNVLQAGANSIRLQSVGAGGDFSLVDEIKLNYARLYKAENNRLRFTVPAGQSVRVGGFDSAEIGIYEIRDGQVATEIVLETGKVDGTHGFGLTATGTDREILAIGKRQAEQAVAVENDYSTNWSSKANKADFVIITPEQFRASADALAQLRRSQGLRTQVVAVEDVYDEFSFGAHSPAAIQAFLRTAATEWTVKPQYALLLGDSSYDSRNYLGGMNKDLISTKLIDTEYLETASDASLADFDNDGIEDIALGRLPAATTEEAAAMISKIQRYEAQGDSKERSNLFVSDREFENYSNALRGLLPEGVNSPMVNRTETTDSQMRQNLLEQLNSDANVVTYTGHASKTFLTNENVFRNADAANLNNRRLSFFMMMTCLNGYTHEPLTDSLAEALMKSNNGAIAVWASSGTTLAENQIQISQAATNMMFNAPRPMRIGAIVRAAKQGTSDQDIRRTWQLIGDPTVFIR